MKKFVMSIYLMRIKSSSYGMINKISEDFSTMSFWVKII